jgi:hypothetical protein
VPFVEVVYDSTITEPMLRQLAELLPSLVAEAVACPEEPDVGPPEPGDLEIRFRPKGPFDIGELNCAVECGRSSTRAGSRPGRIARN